MRNYRVLELRPDGHVTSKFDLSAGDDDAAKEEAQRRHPAKIWSFGVTIERFPNGAVNGRAGSRSGGCLRAVTRLHNNRPPEGGHSSRFSFRLPQ